MWKGKHQGVVFIDIRKEVKPDIVASNESLPFQDETFQKVVYDPPHLIRNSPIKINSLMFKYAYKFSTWKTKSQFYKNLVAVNKEVKRVLQHDGTFIVKHTESPDHLITKNTIIHLLDNFKVLRNRKEKTRGFGKSKVYYITMIKRE